MPCLCHQSISHTGCPFPGMTPWALGSAIESEDCPQEPQATWAGHTSSPYSLELLSLIAFNAWNDQAHPTHMEPGVLGYQHPLPSSSQGMYGPFLWVTAVVLVQLLQHCPVSFLKECQVEPANGGIHQRQKGLGSHDAPVARGVHAQTLSKWPGVVGVSPGGSAGPPSLRWVRPRQAAWCLGPEP